MYKIPAQHPAEPQPDCEQLLLRMQQGDMEAFRGLYETAARTIYAYALSILQNPQDAEEAMQDTFITAWTQCGAYEPAGKPLAWLFTIARNRCYAYLRRQSAHPAVSLEALLDQDAAWEPADGDSFSDRSADRAALLAALSHLSDQERRLIYLHIVASMKHREIASALRLPLPTVLSRYHRALKKLRRELL